VFEPLAWQASLFGDGPVAGDPAFATLHRTRLDDDSWVDYAPGWLSGSDELFALLLQQGKWRQRERWMYEKTVAEPRLTAGFSAAQPPGIGTAQPVGTAAARVSDLRVVPGERVEDLVPGGDRGTRRDDAGTPPALAAVCDLLSDRYGVGFDSIWVNLYRDGADSVAWHGDRNGRTQKNPFVVTISLGGRRLFQLRPKGTTTVTHRFRPGLGDLLVMGGACQHAWEHSVPKTRRPVQPRMSVTIRHSQDAAAQVEIPPEDEW
jgi:alkylated DNA repair dioxygenase AlkB